MHAGTWVPPPLEQFPAKEKEEKRDNKPAKTKQAPDNGTDNVNHLAAREPQDAQKQHRAHNQQQQSDYVPGQALAPFTLGQIGCTHTFSHNHAGGFHLPDWGLGCFAFFLCRICLSHA